MRSPTRDRSPAWTSKQPGKARSTPGKPEQPMTVVPLKRMSFAKPRVETHRRRNKRKSHASAPFRPHTAVRGGQEEGALRSRSPTAEGCAGSDRHVVQRPLIELGDTPPLKDSAGARTRPPSSPHLCAGRQRRRGSAVKKPRRRRRASSPRESSEGKRRLGAPRRAAPVGRTRRQPPAPRALEAPPGRDPGPSPPPHICAGRQWRRGSAVK